MTLTRTLLSAGTLAASAALAAEASEKRVVMDVGAVSALHDRGEQIGRETLELTVGAEFETEYVTFYGAFYRLLPVGAEQAAFEDEADYTIGAAWERDSYSADVSANWLTYPGEDAEASLELAASITLAAPLAPTLTGFYDVDFEDWGVELEAGPEWEAGDWTVYALARAGFVKPGDGGDSRTYGGIEIGAERPVSEFAAFGAFARFDAANEDSFARRIENGDITSFRNSGLSVGIRLSVTP
ncbi:MAG: hypothetical protein ACK46Q_01685 [Hyphomonas sp.]